MAARSPGDADPRAERTESMKKCMVEFNWQLEAAASSRPPRDRPSDRGNRSEPWKPAPRQRGDRAGHRDAQKARRVIYCHKGRDRSFIVKRASA